MLTVHAARERLRRREVSAVELTRACLERIHALNPRLNAYLTVADEAALAMARDADARMARGEDTPLL
ncbi:MAG: amidase family protein, partial [Thermoflexales bacterium]